jgi:hypothetical protein
MKQQSIFDAICISDSKAPSMNEPKENLLRVHLVSQWAGSRKDAKIENPWILY